MLMKNRFPSWTLGLLGILLLILVPVIYYLPRTQASTDPAAHIPAKAVHVDHKDIVKGEFKTGQDVTRACLECHENAATALMKTTHWTWESKAFNVPWRDEDVTIGKINQINNFCIGSQGNENKCRSCHGGYGWEKGKESALASAENVDCLACHADMGTYGKGEFGNPAEGVDLLAAAQSVRAPTRENCGSCHFSGGGGNAVKHGDLDGSLSYPEEHVDVHMGQLGFQCTDCHQTEQHRILGRSISVSVDTANQIYCTDCHLAELHDDQRITDHVDTVACQTCHIPAGAVREPTKIHWDWSTAGNDWPEDPHEDPRIQRSLVYPGNLIPGHC